MPERIDLAQSCEHVLLDLLAGALAFNDLKVLVSVRILDADERTVIPPIYGC